ncbi:MAG: hypothetical protein ACPGU1_16240 [Myxococcota bacterium]
MGFMAADESVDNRTSGAAPTRPGPLPDISGPVDVSLGGGDVPQEEGNGPEPPDELDSGTYLFPGTVAARGQVTASGGMVAWVERTASQSTPVLVVWDVLTGLEPVELRVPNLVNPTQLVLSESWLVYVDDRYGDPDLFAINLETGLEEAVVTAVGAQVEATILGDSVAWRDCRGCVDGGDGAAEIYRLELGSGALAKRVTTSDVDDRAPSLGMLADGTEVLAWVEGERRLRVQGLDVEQSWEVGAFVSTIDIAAGLITWREATGIINPDSMKPLIINPDSMMPVGIINPDSMIPSDVYGTAVATGETHAISVHAELSPELLGRVHAAGAQVAWVEANTAAGEGSLLRVADAATGKVVETIDEPGLWSPSLSTEVVTFIAPRSGNADLDDVWVLPLSPSVP